MDEIRYICGRKTADQAHSEKYHQPFLNWQWYFHGYITSALYNVLVIYIAWGDAKDQGDRIGRSKSSPPLCMNYLSKVQVKAKHLHLISNTSLRLDNFFYN